MLEVSCSFTFCVPAFWRRCHRKLYPPTLSLCLSLICMWAGLNFLWALMRLRFTGPRSAQNPSTMNEAHNIHCIGFCGPVNLQHLNCVTLMRCLWAQSLVLLAHGTTHASQQLLFLFSFFLWANVCLYVLGPRKKSKRKRDAVNAGARRASALALIGLPAIWPCIPLHL